MSTKHHYLCFAVLCSFLIGPLALAGASARILAASSRSVSGSIRAAGSDAALSNTRASALDRVASIEGSVGAVGVSGTLAYIGAGSSLVVLDIGNPAQPNRLARLTPGGGDIIGLQIAGDRVYLTFSDGVLRIVDIRDPRQPALLSTYHLALVSMQAIGNLAYAIVQGGSGRIYDASNPLDLRLRGSYAPTSGFYALDMQVVGGLAYVASYDSGFQLVQPTKPYSITIQYGDAERGPAIESTLALYFWDGGAWAKEPSSAVDIAAHTVSATPSHFSVWALLGETQRAFMPLAQR